MAEAFRSLRTNIRYSRADSPPEVIMVTSSGMGEGKTTTAINLAMAHIQAGDRVILVDGDLRRPAVAKGLKIEGDKGLSSYLIGEESVEPMIQHPDDFGGLAVLPSGPTPPNPARLLESNKLATLMTSLREKYDLVIIDSPPTGLLSDTQVLAPLADGVVLVADATKTRRPMFQRALKQLMRTGTPCLGGIMNRVPTRRGGYYDYHYGGHYGGGAGKGKKK
jgi:capsular exopolysaccharide synthesis family protein